MSDATRDKIESFIDNPWTKLIARAAMFLTPIVVGYIGNLTLSYLEIKFSEQAEKTASVAYRVDRLESGMQAAGLQANAINTRLSVVENNQLVSRDRNQRLQDQIGAKLDAISSDITTIKEKVAAIGAKVDTINSSRILR